MLLFDFFSVLTLIPRFLDFILFLFMFNSVSVDEEFEDGESLGDFKGVLLVRLASDDLLWLRLFLISMI